MEVIKKYHNRKLYSTTLSKYVTLNYVLDLVKLGHKFQVIDSKTSADITKKVTKQSITLLDLSHKDMIELIRRA